jgi:hypothetical protein
MIKRILEWGDQDIIFGDFIRLAATHQVGKPRRPSHDRRSHHCPVLFI